MRRIVLTEQQKREYELRAKELQARALIRGTRKYYRKSKDEPIYCKRCGTRSYKKMAWMNGHAEYCSRRCLRKGPRPKSKQEQVRVPPVLSYKRDYKEESVSFFESEEWRRLRFETLIRHGRKCLCCGAEPPRVVLHVDHIKPRYRYPELALEPSNLQVLCSACNLGKGVRFETDFRDKK